MSTKKHTDDYKSIEAECENTEDFFKSVRVPTQETITFYTLTLDRLFGDVNSTRYDHHSLRFLIPKSLLESHGLRLPQNQFVSSWIQIQDLWSFCRITITSP